mmetsp:Transcript_3587/g.3773  ORF Transcript_3587/g.3773 Transcript_3587/m.3773 type:complete len:248 (+) Transcript_3587:369-1112(+)
MGVLDSIYEIPGMRKLHVTLNQLVSYIPPPPSKNQGIPRKILLVTSHPVPESFSLVVAGMVEETAKEQGHEFQRIDLGLENFSPVLTKKERRAYFDDAEKKEEKYLPKDVCGHIQKLKWCDTLIFVYPTWWMNTPAVLKGFFDRSMLLHQTWHLPKEELGIKRILPQGLVPGLKNIEQVVGISTYGCSQPVVTLAGDNGRRMISTAILPIFSVDCTIRWHGLYEIDSQTDEGRRIFLDEVKELVKGV